MLPSINYNLAMIMRDLAHLFNVSDLFIELVVCVGHHEVSIEEGARPQHILRVLIEI